MRFGLGFLLSLGLGSFALAAPWDEVSIVTQASASVRASPLSMQRGATSDTLRTVKTLRLAPFAKSLGKISAMTLSERGTIFTADVKTGRIWALNDRGQDGSVDIRRPLPQTFHNPTGLAMIGDILYVADKRAVWALDIEQNAPPRLVASLANAKSIGEHPLTQEGDHLLLGITQAHASIIVRVDPQIGRAEKIAELPEGQIIHSLAKRESAPLWVGAGQSLQSTERPDTAITFAEQTISGLMLPGQYEAPQDWPIALNDHIIASQSGPNAMQVIAVPTKFGQPSAAPRILVDGFLSSTGRSAWGEPGALVMDKRGLFFADRYNGMIWRLSPAPNLSPTIKEDIKVASDDTANTPAEPAYVPPSQRPLLKGSGITGSQIEDASRMGEASQLKTGSTIIEAYEKAEAEAAELAKKEGKLPESESKSKPKSKR